MDLPRFVLLLALAQLPLLTQAFLLHPYYQKCRMATMARWALGPLGFASLAWLAVEWRAGLMKIHHHATPAVGTLIMFASLRGLILASAPGPYYRLRSKNHPESSQVFNHSVSFLERLRHAYLILINPRGIGWSFGVPTTCRNESASTFLFDTLRRLFKDLVILVVSLIFIAKLYDSPGSQTLFSRHLVAFFAGTLIWTWIDSTGCYLRLAAFALRLDPAEYPFFLQSPLFSTNLAEFWSRRWHSLLRQVFVEFGSKPALWVVRRLYGPGALSRAMEILGAFLISGLIHEFGLWFSSNLDPTFCTTFFFLSQGVGVVIEATYARITGRRVSGLMGWVWTMSWLLGWGQPMIEVWLERDVIDRKLLKQIRTQFDRLLFFWGGNL